jgi:hypothetical protein
MTFPLIEDRDNRPQTADHDGTDDPKDSTHKERVSAGDPSDGM